MDAYQSNLHADLPILAKSHFKQWYIYLVVSVLGVMFLISLGVVTCGIYTCVRRKRCGTPVSVLCCLALCLQQRKEHQKGSNVRPVHSLLERSASKKQRAREREHDLELGRCPPMNGGVQGVQKVSRVEMLSYKPTPQDDDRLR